MQGSSCCSGHTNSTGKTGCGNGFLYPVSRVSVGRKCYRRGFDRKRKVHLYMFMPELNPSTDRVAESEDGIVWKRLSEEPFLKNSKPGEWNSSESGHPHILPIWTVELICSIREITITEKPGISHREEVIWKNGKPFLKEEESEKRS